MGEDATSRVLGGATAGTASGGVRAAGLLAGASTSGPGGGAATPAPTAGGATAFALAGGGQGARTPEGGAASVVPVPNGSIGRVGLMPGTLAPHAHEDAASGGVIDYARVVVSPTAPPAPVSPSDAFWLNPEEEA